MLFGDLGAPVVVGGEQFLGLRFLAENAPDESDTVAPRIGLGGDEHRRRDGGELVVVLRVPSLRPENEVGLRGSNVLDGRFGHRADRGDAGRFRTEIGRHTGGFAEHRRADGHDAERDRGVEFHRFQGDDPQRIVGNVDRASNGLDRSSRFAGGPVGGIGRRACRRSCRHRERGDGQRCQTELELHHFEGPPGRTMRDTKEVSLPCKPLRTASPDGGATSR